MARARSLGLVALGAGAPAWANQGGGQYEHAGMWGGGHGMWFGPVVMIAFVVVAVVTVILLVLWIGGERPIPDRRPESDAARTPLDVLKMRYAKGEIDKHEFEERKRTLGG